MNESILMAQIVAAVRKVAKVPRDIPITPQTCLIDDLRIDSLDLFAVILEIQDRFDIIFEVEDLPRVHRVADLAEFVVNYRETAAA
ncbi:acyl carrier protein [Tundrisphaera lichenicola]|uniref:acyl carrier protein n=1 Tax=Tundrisphaera lichenicola TaxID=2029860 RepID=UPI003EBFF7F5